MSFAVIHMQKIKMGGVRGVQNHNERLKESHTNPDINYDKSYLNQKLDNQPDEKTYYNRIRDRIKELNLPKAVRKDAVTMCGFVCTSDKPFFEKLAPEEQKRYFQESYNFLKDRYGEKNVVAAQTHLDEKTPHMHCYIVPVTPDGRLSAKDIFNKVELSQLQTKYYEHMVSRGFDLERGKSSEKKHLDVQEFKLETKKQEIEQTKAELKELQEVKTNVMVNVEKGALGYSTKDVDELKKLAEAEKLRNYELERDIRERDNKINTLENKLKTVEKKVEEIKPLQSELNILKNESKALERYLENNPKAMQELERHMSFKKQVHAEGKAMAELKENYANLSTYEKKFEQNVSALKGELHKTLTDISDIDQKHGVIQKLNSEISELHTQREEIGKFSFKNAFKATERKNLDNSIAQKENSLKTVTDDLRTKFNILPEELPKRKKDLQEQAQQIKTTIVEQEQSLDKVKVNRGKVLDDYKYLKGKSSLYSEPYRNIIAEKIKGIDIDYFQERELNSFSKADIQKIHDRLPDGLKDKFENKVQEQTAKVHNHTQQQIMER